VSPTARTLAELRKRGAALVQVVERWNQYAKIRQDLFGIVDVLAVMPSGKTVAVQSTSGSNVSSRVKKIVESDAIHLLRLAGWTVLVHGWRKNSKGRYELREVDLS
jgi:hypothetical protein